MELVKPARAIGPESYRRAIGPERSRRGIATIIILLVGISIGLLAVKGYTYFSNKKTPEEQIIPKNYSRSLTTPSPSPDETAGWKTYTGVGFSFKYPATWTVVQNDTLETIRPTTEKPTGDYSPGVGSISIRISTDSQQKIIDSQSGVLKKGETLVAGKPATRLKGISGVAGSVYYTMAIVSVNNQSIVLTLTTQDSGIESELSLEFDQILSTFKFAN